jgi:hypothetical protein
MFKKSMPKWVREYPDEMDKVALTQLAKSSKGPFEKEREMNFSLYDFVPGAPLEEAVAKIKEHGEGWRCFGEPQIDAPGKIVLTATKKDYALTQSNYTNDVIFFQRIAKMYNAKYDGWFASN